MSRWIAANDANSGINVQKKRSDILKHMIYIGISPNNQLSFKVQGFLFAICAKTNSPDTLKLSSSSLCNPS